MQCSFIRKFCNNSGEVRNDTSDWAAFPTTSTSVLLQFILYWLEFFIYWFISILVTHSPHSLTQFIKFTLQLLQIAEKYSIISIWSYFHPLHKFQFRKKTFQSMEVSFLFGRVSNSLNYAFASCISESTASTQCQENYYYLNCYYVGSVPRIAIRMFWSAYPISFFYE